MPNRGITLSRKTLIWIGVAILAVIVVLGPIVYHLAMIPQHPESLAAAHYVGECPDVAHCNYIHKTFGLLSDGPHITAEATVSLVENAIELGILLLVGRWYVRREHRLLDAEHGVVHHEVDQ